MLTVKGYGPRTGPREMSAAAGDKKSRRFVPYESPERRTYKTIVPAPPQPREKGSPLSSGSEAPPIPPVPIPPVEAQIPKRQRIEPIQPEHSKATGHNTPRAQIDCVETVQETIEQAAPPFTEYQSRYRYRYGDANRITISSLLTVDQETIAEYQTQQQALHQYIPSFYYSSPLNDASLVSAFKHFVEVVAPTMSLVECAPPNPSILNYHNYPDPGAKAVNLFTFQLPMMALAGNWAVMEAILALSLLHIAHMTRSSKQQAYLHYQIAIKRLRIESSREGASRDLGILAAMLLLAWYELTTGDHVRTPLICALPRFVEFGD
jgi:Fungal specific transcription factor domain